MRSEAEIRKQVETRLRRWGLLVLNAILWVGAAKLLYEFAQYSSLGRFDGLIVLVMVAWAALVGLHALRTFYVEGKEWLVRRAIDRETRDYLLRETYEKPKRDDASLRLSDDGELVEWTMDETDAKAKHER